MGGVFSGDEMASKDAEVEKWWSTEQLRRLNSTARFGESPALKPRTLKKKQQSTAFVPGGKRFRGIISSDENSNILSANVFVARLLGYSPTEMVGQPVEMIMPSPHREHHRGYVAAFQQKGAGHVINKPRRLEALHKCGVLVPIFLTVSPMTTGSKTKYVALIEPAEETSGEVSIDREGVILAANPAARDMFGYTQLEMEGFNVSRLMPEPHASHHDMYIKSYLSTGVAKAIGRARNLVGLHRSGRLFPISLQVKEVPNATARGVAFTASIICLEDMDASLTLDKDGVITSATQTVGLLFGYRADDIEGQLITSFIPKIIEFIREGLDDAQEILSATHHDGSFFEMLIDFKRFTEEDGAYYNVFLTRPPSSDSPKTAEEASALSNYAITKLVGTGSSAKVYLAKDIRNQQTRAIKTVRLDWLDKYGGKGAREKLTREISIMKMCSHDNIIRLYDVVESSDKMHLVMDYCECGDLTEFWTGEDPIDGGLPLKAAQRIFLDLVAAVRYLHELNIVHCDIKLDNCMLTTDGSTKLIDFGFASVIEKSLSTFCGTPLYAAPEIFLNVPFGKAADVWSLGVVLYILVVGLFPFNTPDQIVRGEYSFPDDCMVPSKVTDLIDRMLSVAPSERPTMEEISNIEWIRAPWSK